MGNTFGTEIVAEIEYHRSSPCILGIFIAVYNLHGPTSFVEKKVTERLVGDTKRCMERYRICDIEVALESGFGPH
jgi:hypothetical protein